MGSACSGGQSVNTAEAGNAGPSAKEEDQQQQAEQKQPEQQEDNKEQVQVEPAPPDSANSNPQAESARNGDVPPSTESAQPQENNTAQLNTTEDGPVQYKLVYFDGFRFRAEPIRLILRLAGVPYEERLVSIDEWPKMKESTLMGALPVFYVNDRVLCQSNAIARFLARKYGFAGKTNLEMAKVDMLVDALTDVMNELTPLILEQEQGKKSDMWHQLKDDVICPFLDRCINILAGNSTGWFVGDQVTWADLAVSEVLANLTDKMDSTLLSTYPALQAHINGVRALPRIEEYLANRPEAAL